MKSEVIYFKSLLIILLSYNNCNKDGRKVIEKRLNQKLSEGDSQPSDRTTGEGDHKETTQRLNEVYIRLCQPDDE